MRLSVLRRRTLGGIVTVFTLLVLLSMQAGALARLQASLDSPSPATGHASVIAQGVAEIPFDPIAWRVVLDTAEPLDVALPVERALGFVATDTDGVHVVDVSAGTQERLAPGEASFVPESAIQTRASLTDAETRYFRIALVAEADVADPGNDELLFAGEAFAAPEGLRDIDLLRDVLAEDEESEIAGSDYPVLIIATGGAIEVDAGGQPVELQAGEAAEFTGDITVLGLQDGSSFIAGVIGPEVPVPPRTSGSITVATYLCEPGVTPENLGDPADEEVAGTCAPVSDDMMPALVTPDGAELTTEDAEGVREGVYAWLGIPFGDYTVVEPAELPSGAGNPTFYDSEGNLLADGDVTIDRENPDAHLDLYLFQAGSGSIAMTFFACPEGWSFTDGDRAECEQIADGFGITIAAGDEEGGEITLADADFADGEYVWTGLGLSPDPDTVGAGYYYIADVSTPEGYNAWAVDGASIVPDAEGTTYVDLTAESPDADLAMYFISDEAPVGTITLDTLECPSVESGPQDCSRTFGPGQLTGIYIQDFDGNYGALTEANASQEGDGPFVWPQVPLTSYFMDTTGLTAPEGYQIVSVVMTPDGADVSNGFTLSEDNPIANIVVLLAPVGDGNETETPVDSDSDGLSDTNEASAGTDAANPDSDSDCHADGPEVDAGTDPLSADSFPDGDCDTIESTTEN